MVYVDRTEDRMATAEGRAETAARLAAWGVDRVAIYRLHRILRDDALRARLPALLDAIREAGVREIYAVVGSVRSVRDVDAFHRAERDAGRRIPFDGLVSEYEFWREGNDFETYLSLLRAMQRQAETERAEGRPFLTLTYLGWPDAAETQALAPFVDVVLLHAYVKRPRRIARYLRERWQRFDALGDARPEMWVLLSAEMREEERRSGPEFLGAWLRDRREDGVNALRSAEQRSGGDLEAMGHRAPGGYAWFAMRHLERALIAP